MMVYFPLLDFQTIALYTANKLIYFLPGSGKWKMGAFHFTMILRLSLLYQITTLVKFISIIKTYYDAVLKKKVLQ